jgi:hypothetical protein
MSVNIPELVARYGVTTGIVIIPGPGDQQIVPADPMRLALGISFVLGVQGSAGIIGPGGFSFTERFISRQFRWYYWHKHGSLVNQRWLWLNESGEIQNVQWCTISTNVGSA